MRPNPLTWLALAALLGGPACALAQNTAEENNPNLDAPFVRNIRADRPGQTITAQVLRAGRVQLENGFGPETAVTGAAQLAATATLRIGFFGSSELRVSQRRQYRTLDSLQTGDQQQAAGWLPLMAGFKLMLSPHFDTRTQVALLAQTVIPETGSGRLKATTPGPEVRVLVSEQIGQRFGLEANVGYQQPDLEPVLGQGQFVGTLALNGPVGHRAGFFAEAYGTGYRALTAGSTGGLYWRPVPFLRLDVNASRVVQGPTAGSSTVGAGLVVKVGRMDF